MIGDSLIVSKCFIHPEIAVTIFGTTMNMLIMSRYHEHVT